MFRLSISRPIEFLLILVYELSHKGIVTFEGDFDAKLFRNFPVASASAISVVQQHTSYPEQQFVFLRLNAHADWKNALNQVGVRNRVDHIHVVSDGLIIFASYDRFKHAFLEMKFGSKLVRFLGDAGVVSHVEVDSKVRLN